MPSQPLGGWESESLSPSPILEPKHSEDLTDAGWAEELTKPSQHQDSALEGGLQKGWDQLPGDIAHVVILLGKTSSLRMGDELCRLKKNTPLFSAHQEQIYFLVHKNYPELRFSHLRGTDNGHVCGPAYVHQRSTSWATQRTSPTAAGGLRGRSGAGPKPGHPSRRPCVERCL